LLAGPQAAQAAPIVGPTWVVDTPTAATVTFSHGPITDLIDVHIIAPPPAISPSGIWSIPALVIVASDLGGLLDLVVTVGTFMRTAPGSPTFTYTPAIVSTITPLTVTETATLPGPGGSPDFYSATLAAVPVAPGSPQIASFTLTISVVSGVIP